MTGSGRTVRKASTATARPAANAANARLIEQFYGAFGRRDVDAMLA
jgi:hypothetical protein